MDMAMSSPAFGPMHEIPARYTCDGMDLPPPLVFSGVPAKAASLVLIVDDPDAPDPARPQRTWVHWVVVDLPSAAKGLPEGGRPLPAGAREGVNDWGRVGWGGPCPPVGRHRYFFKLYALDAALPALPRPTKAEVERAMQGHVIAQAQLVGTYERKR